MRCESYRKCIVKKKKKEKEKRSREREVMVEKRRNCMRIEKRKNNIFNKKKKQILITLFHIFPMW